MKFFDYISFSFKNLARRKARTLLTIIAITIGSLSVILMVSLLTGIRQSLVDMLQEMDAFSLVTVTRDPDAVDNGGSIITSGNGDTTNGKKLDDAAFNTLKKLNNVADATPIGGGIWMDTMKLEGQNKKMWASLISYQPDTSVFQMPLEAGRKLKNDDMDKIVVGGRFVKTYGYANNPQDLIGKRIVFNMKMGGNAPDWGPLPEKPPMNADKEWWEAHNDDVHEITAEIVGIAKNSAMDDNQNYINIAWAQKLMTQVRWESSECKNNNGPCEQIMQLVKDDQFTKNGYGSIILKANDTKNLGSIADAVSGLGYGVSTAQDMMDEINNIFAGIGIILGVIGGISLFVAAIGIINTMVMATFERTREIGVMRACGATRATIRHLFTFEAAMLGFWGGLFGLGLSYLIGKVGTQIADKYATDIPIPVDQVAQFPWWLVTGVVAFTTLIGLMSGLGPAIRAARLNPVDALRYE